MKRLLLIVTMLLGVGSFRSSAQFVLDGEDPARLRWNQAEWGKYKLIYPQGLDSLARVYGTLLEEYRIPVSRSTGVVPGAGFRNRLPVVLHAVNGVSNGMVAWAPKRMEFHTLAQPYQTWALPWEKSLAIHESRHVSQMSVGYQGIFRPLRWIAGDALPLAVPSVYTPDYLMEGDAVVAETALTEAGRGRDGDFLNYYQSAFASGNYRNWPAWRRGSWRRYTPNVYALGYMLISGTRVFHDDPMFMGNIYTRLAKGNLLRFQSAKYELASASGMKFRQAWPDLLDRFGRIWEENAASRGPFISSEFVTDVPSWYEIYAHGTFAGDDLLVVRSGLLRAARLSRVESDGTVTGLRPFAASTSHLAYDAESGRLYWSETIGSPRWEHEAVSRVRYIDLVTDRAQGRGRPAIKDLTSEGRLYNPVPSPDGKLIAAVDYPYEGGTALVLLDAETGAEISRRQAPAGLQLTVPAWYGTASGGTAIAVTGLSDDGMGIYSIDPSAGSLSVLLAPVHAKIADLRYHDTGLIFSSDRTGVNEIYQLRGDDVLQLTSTRFGAYSGFFHGDSLYFVTRETGIARTGADGCSLRKYGEGELLHKASAADLLYRKVDYQDIYRDPVAQALSEQEQALASEGQAGEAGTMVTSPARKYSKLAHIPRIHTWVPLNVRVNKLASINLDNIPETAGIGATVLFQNDLSTASGFVSYGYNLSPLRREGVWTNLHSAHLDFTYSGLYPAFELQVDYGDRPAADYYRTRDDYGDRLVDRVGYNYSDRPSLNASMRVYIPLRFNSGGVLRGLTPTLKYTYSNDFYRKSLTVFDHGTSLSGTAFDHADFAGSTDGKTVRMQNFSASLTGYIMQPSAASLEYPRLGVGLQAGYHQRIGLSDIYSAGAYGYAYGYLPGLARTHGMKLTATAQHTFGALYAENVVVVSPRGFAASDADRHISLCSGNQLKLTADYALQFGIPHRQLLSGLFHFTHMVVTPHFDVSLFPYKSDDRGIMGSLHTAGADITLRSANLAFLPVRTSIGVTINCNGGPAYDTFLSDGCAGLSRTYVGFLFNLDI